MINLQMNYNQAIAHCKTLDAHLVRVNDDAENDYIARILQDKGEIPTHIHKIINNVHDHPWFEINNSKIGKEKDSM